MKRKAWLVAIGLAALPVAALADYVIKDGNGAVKTILSATVSGKILPLSSIVDQTGNPAVSATGTPAASAVTVQEAALLRTQSNAAGSNLVIKATAGSLSSLTIDIGATSGWLMLFDAVALPSNGAVTPAYCWPITSDGAKGAAAFAWPKPKPFSTGIVAGFSTTGCLNLTASATATFYGDYQ